MYSRRKCNTQHCALI